MQALYMHLSALNALYHSIVILHMHLLPICNPSEATKNSYSLHELFLPLRFYIIWMQIALNCKKETN